MKMTEPRPIKPSRPDGNERPSDIKLSATGRLFELTYYVLCIHPVQLSRDDLSVTFLRQSVDQ